MSIGVSNSNLETFGNCDNPVLAAFPRFIMLITASGTLRRCMPSLMTTIMSSNCQTKGLPSSPVMRECHHKSTRRDTIFITEIAKYMGHTYNMQ